MLHSISVLLWALVRFGLPNNQQPILRQQDRVEDSLLCMFCMQCWGKLRWCRNGCCDTLRAVSSDLEAREASEAVLASDVATLRCTNESQGNELKRLQQTLTAANATIESLKDLIMGYRSSIKTICTRETKHAIHDLMKPKLTEHDANARKRGHEASDQSKEGTVDQSKSIRKPRGLKTILAEASKHRAGDSMLRQLRNVADRNAKHQNYRKQKIEENVGDDNPGPSQPKQKASSSRLVSPTPSNLALLNTSPEDTNKPAVDFYTKDPDLLLALSDDKGSDEGNDSDTGTDRAVANDENDNQPTGEHEESAAKQ